MKIQSSQSPQPKRKPVGSPSSDQRQPFMEEVKEAVEEVASEVIELGSKLPPLKKLGYKLYDHFSRPDATTPALQNTQSLDPKLMRGAQPTQQGFAELKKQGVQTIINLRPESDWEKPMVEEQGMKYLYLPLPAVGSPSMEQALDFLSAATDPANGKVFFHCQRGKDRTGAMAAVYRMAVQGWTLDQAAAEMRRFGAKEGFEEDKLDFIRKFAPYWEALDPTQKALILHRPIT